MKTGYSYFRNDMIVDKSTEYYLINSMGLTKIQIKKMLPSEIEEHCNKMIKQRIVEKSVNKSKKK